MGRAADLRVGIDATSLIGPGTGVAALTRALVAGLAPRDDLTLRLFAVTWRGRGELGAGAPAAEVARRPMAARPLRTLWRRIDVPPIEWWTGPIDVVHCPNFVVPPARTAARLMTIHDLTAWRFPELVDSSTRAYPALVDRASRRGAWIHVPSQTVGAEVVAELGAPEDRVVVIPNGAPELPAESATTDAARGRAVAGSERYVLALGTIEPRKDLPGLVRAFDAVAADDPDLHLVVAGPRGWGTEAYEAAVVAASHHERIHTLGWVDGDDRAALLRGAAVVAYPSVYEGFGLVPLEAMAAGVPVVATRAGAIPEVVGDAAELVPVGDIDALAAGLDRVLSDTSRRDALVAAGRQRRAQLSWDQTVSAMADLYRRISDRR